MIYSKAPFRIGLAGGGTDVSPYSELFGGLVLNATISLYARVTIETNDSGLIIFRSADQGIEETHAMDFPIASVGKFILLKGVFNRIKKDYGLPINGMIITSNCDVPPGSGLGTSSTLVIAAVGAFLELVNIKMDRFELPHYAYSIEREDLDMAGGKQDQYAAAYGGFNFMEFKNGMVAVYPLRLEETIISTLQNNLLLYYTSETRDSSVIIKEQAQNVINHNEESIEAMHRLKEQTKLMKTGLTSGLPDTIGIVLDFGFKYKKLMAHNISNERIEAIYASAKKAGASGGKISGAGGGGFMVFYCPGDTKQDVINALAEWGGEIKPYAFVKDGLSTWRE